MDSPSQHTMVNNSVKVFQMLEMKITAGVVLDVMFLSFVLFFCPLWPVFGEIVFDQYSVVPKKKRSQNLLTN